MLWFLAIYVCITSPNQALDTECVCHTALLNVSLYSGLTSTSCPRGSNKTVYVSEGTVNPLWVFVTYQNLLRSLDLLASM